MRACRVGIQEARGWPGTWSACCPLGHSSLTTLAQCSPMTGCKGASGGGTWEGGLGQCGSAMASRSLHCPPTSSKLLKFSKPLSCLL